MTTDKNTLLDLYFFFSKKKKKIFLILAFKHNSHARTLPKKFGRVFPLLSTSPALLAFESNDVKLKIIAQIEAMVAIIGDCRGTTDKNTLLDL